MSLAHNSPTCRNCTALLPMGASSCATCGHSTTAGPAYGIAPASYPAYQAAPGYPGGGAPIVVVTAKSAGIAVLLTFLWLGAGHLYVGKIGAGIALIVLDFVLYLLAFTLVGAIVAVPVWIVSFAIAAVLASNAVTEFNRRNGIVVR